MRECSSRAGAFPERFSNTLRIRHTILKNIRSFFDNRGYIEVETPLRVRCPCMDPYIDALEAGDGFYLSTSPEFHMKRLLALDIDCMYQITRAFRAEEQGQHHNSEFTMLEWYRKGTDYLGILDETEDLIRFLASDIVVSGGVWQFPFERMTVGQLYRLEAGWDPCSTWDEDRYFRDWVEKIEPSLQSLRGVFLLDFPAPLAALSKIRRDNPAVCERFELFMDGIEIGNAFTELTDYREHEIRFQTTREKRQAMHKTAYPVDELFMQSIRSGCMQDTGGIAIGIDRLVMALLDLQHIDMVQAFPLSRV